MNIDDLKIVHYYPFWLPKTQTWMYTLIKEQNRLIHPSILCEKIIDADQFILPGIVELRNIYGKRYEAEAALRNLRILKALPCMDNYLQRNRPSLLHSHFGNFGWINQKIASKRGLPHVVSFYGADASQLPSENRKWYRRYRELFKGCSAVLVEGSNMARKLKGLGCADEKIIIQKIGVDLQKIPYTPRVWNRGETLKVLIAASFREKKGIPLALRALDALQKELPLEIVIIGDATGDTETLEQKKQIMQILQESGLLQKTKLKGFLPYEKIFEIAADCHLFLHPSRVASNGDDEGGAPVILTEMAASGMPVVGTFHCDIPEVILHEKSGFLSRENDVDDLVLQIKKWTDAPDCWRSLLDCGRKHIESEYDIMVQTGKMLSIYLDLCRERVK